MKGLTPMGGVGRDAIEEARARGRSMTLPDALALALEEPGGSSASGSA